MHALILAAGRGERLRPLTDDLPKPLLPVGGRPLIDYLIEALARAGVRQLVVKLSWHADQLRRHLGGQRHDVSIAFSEEGPVPMETGGGIHHALPLLGDAPFWVVNGDIACDYRYTPPALPPDALAHLILVANPPHNPAGDFALDGALVRVPSADRNPGLPTHTFAGISILSPQLFAGCSPGRFPLAPLLRRAADRGQVTGELHTGRWTDVGTLERLRAVDAELRGLHAVSGG